MQTIYKYPFPVADSFSLDLPSGAIILHVECQNGQPCIWALVDTEALPERRTFYLFGTGHPLNIDDFGWSNHLATFQQGPFVWHMFQDRPGGF